jgi:two-component system, LytTR family, sensor kinase
MNPKLPKKYSEFPPLLKKIYNGQRHIIFWTIYIGYGILYQSVVFPKDISPWYAEALRYLSFISVYFGAYFSTKLVFKNNKLPYFTITCYLFIGLSLFCFIQYAKDYFIFDFKEIYFANYYLQIQEIFLVCIFAVFLSLIEFTERLNQTIIDKQQLKNEKTINENSIRRSKEILIRYLDKTIAEAEHKDKLVDFQEFKILVDFLINNTHKSLIPIALEIENLHRYLKLYKFRSGKNDIFQVEITGEFFDRQIPHKAILTLVENTIKHGDLGQPITIYIDSLPSCLKIAVKNKISSQPSVIKSTNIGLANLKDRLELHLKNRHKIEILKEEGCFEVCIWVF